MISNYLKIAWRNILRQKSYSIINVIGLSAGIAVCLVIFVLIQFHSNFDNFHAQKSRIYRLLTEYHHADTKEIFYGYGISGGIPAALRADMPELEEIVPVFNQNNDQFEVPDAAGQIQKKFKETDGVFVTTPAFFKLFNFPTLAGNASTALKDPNSVILTKEMAEKYFGDWKAAMGKTIKWNNKILLKVTAVLATIPANTDFQLRHVISFGTGFTAEIAKSKEFNGTSTDFGCYVLLRSGVSANHAGNRLRALMKKYHAPDNKDSEVIQPLSQVHFDSKVGDYSNKTISPQMISMLWLIAIFILVIACVNFVNLATAQAVNRAKEIGIRKVLGSKRSQLQVQFLTETFIIVALAVVFAAGLSIICIPFVGRMLDLPLSAAFLENVSVAAFLLLVLVLVTLVAGFYPSVVISGYNPINALKSKISATRTRGATLRRGLVVFQFIIAQALIICTLVIVKQMNYFNNASMGFAKDAIVNVPFPTDSLSLTKLNFLKKRLADLKGVEQLSFSSNVPVGEDAMWTTFNFEHSPKPCDFYSILKFTDDQFLKTYQLKLVAGRNFMPSDTIKEFIVNEAMLKKLGIINPESALNKQIALGPRIKGSIVGVLKDYHNRSFRDDYAPMLLATSKNQYRTTSIKLSSADFASSIQSMGKIWDETFPDYTFEYQFLDQHIADFYKQENQLSNIYTLFAGVAILLSCLGLYGLASFMAVQRTKEVGIRKVLGASVSGIVFLFSKEFIVLILLGFLIAAPVTWYFMQKWLQDYTYRITIRWDIFVVAGGMAIVIALATIGFQLVKAAIANPVKSLRAE